MRSNQRRVFAGAIAFAAAVGLTACGSSGDSGGSDSGKIELSIGTFTEFGYEDLLPEYEKLHPNIKITHHKTGEGGPYAQNMLTKLAAGNGLEDVVAIEEGHLPDVIDKSQLFNNLADIGPKDAKPDRWLEWKYKQGVAKDGTWIGYGTDSGPLAMCYRKDLLTAAGMPTDDASVKAMFATWDSYFEAGDTYVQKTGKAWFDSDSQVFNAMQNQLPVGYITKDDKLALESNKDIRKNYDKVTAAGGRGQTAKLVAFSPEWNTGFKQGAFATKTCPSWMLGVVKEQAGPDNANKWAVTDAFPNGGGNWGGSYLTVPLTSAHPKEAAELAAWLTAPEQQLYAFRISGNFPSQVEAFESPDLISEQNGYFGGALIGQVFVAQARKVGKPQYKGSGDGEIQETVIAPALKAVEHGSDPAAVWQQVLTGVHRIVP